MEQLGEGKGQCIGMAVHQAHDIVRRHIKRLITGHIKSGSQG
jgi:hypothetical protein